MIKQEKKTLKLVAWYFPTKLDHIILRTDNIINLVYNKVTKNLLKQKIHMENTSNLLKISK